LKRHICGAAVSLLSTLVLLAEAVGAGAAWPEAMLAERAKVAAIRRRPFKPFNSGVIRGTGEPRRISVDISGIADLWLITTDAGDGIGSDQSVWADPILITEDGKKVSLTQIAMRVARVGSGRIKVNRAHGGRPLSIGGREFKQGIYTHANSLVCYRIIGAKFVRFEAWIGLHTAAKKNGSVTFRVSDRPVPAARQTWHTLSARYPVHADWVEQDFGNDILWWFESGDTKIEQTAVRRVAAELGDAGKPITNELDKLIASKTPASDPRWLGFYVKACEARRESRLRLLLRKHRKIVFVKRADSAVAGANHFAYTESLSDGHAYFTFRPGSSLCVLEMNGIYGTVRKLIDDRGGVLRDPDVSFDGKRILFAWKKSARKDDYHLYEMDVAAGKVRQLTSGLGFADFEGIYLPDGNILFNSSRCVQMVDCDWSEVSNLYLCDKDGKYMRRVGFDQVHTNNPKLLADGRVIYTRWDYNDRSQVWPQGLLQMNPDGTGQTEFYGNNSWFPTSILHARPIPGSQKVVAVLGGHHAHQRGKLAVIDRRKGQQEASGVQLVAPVRKTVAVRVDSYGQSGEQFRYPFPLSETEYVVSRTPNTPGNRRYGRPFWLYWMAADGRRELLVSDPRLGCYDAIPLAPRPRPHVRPRLVNYRKDSGTVFLQDVYLGPGLRGIPRGTVKRLRVVALVFRPTNVGNVGCAGPGGASAQACPVAVGNGTYDVKKVLGTATVYKDGSACFTVPARTAVYFQALDAKGHAIQTMRSWATLQPGERFSCIGCHEPKNAAPPVRKMPAAMRAGPEELKPFYGPPRGFSFIKEIQPILDRNCIRCHNVRPGRPKPKTKPKAVFSLLGVQNRAGGAGRKWSDSYMFFTKCRGDRGTPNPIVNWLNVQSIPTMLPPYYKGAAKSKLITMLEKGHAGVKLSREEMDKIACWIDLLVPYCGEYDEASAWSAADRKRFDRHVMKRKRSEELERKNIDAFIRDGEKR